MPEQREARQRILEATYACIARWGISKTTIEDAAREAGMSRATVYRHFPGGREELISATVAWEELRFFSRLYDELRDAPTLEEVLKRGLPFAHRAIVEHEVLQRVLETEPGLLLPKLTVESTRASPLSSVGSSSPIWYASGSTRESKRTRPPTCSPVWCSGTSRRRVVGISTTLSRSRAWCAPSCFRGSCRRLRSRHGPSFVWLVWPV